jgi:hypothetical protein
MARVRRPILRRKRQLLVGVALAMAVVVVACGGTRN